MLFSQPIFLPVFLGIAAVIQGGLNRQIADQWGLVSAVLFNTLIMLVFTASLLAVAKWRPEWLPEFFRMKGGFDSFRWWYLIPSLCGLALVVGIPFVIQRVGAFPVFLGILGGQMVMSLAWDALIEHRPLTSLRPAGAGMAVLSAWLVGRQG